MRVSSRNHIDSKYQDGETVTLAVAGQTSCLLQFMFNLSYNDDISSKLKKFQIIKRTFTVSI